MSGKNLASKPYLSMDSSINLAAELMQFGPIEIIIIVGTAFWALNFVEKNVSCIDYIHEVYDDNIHFRVIYQW